MKLQVFSAPCGKILVHFFLEQNRKNVFSKLFDIGEIFFSSKIYLHIFIYFFYSEEIKWSIYTLEHLYKKSHINDAER
jgi:hypothetical protein